MNETKFQLIYKFHFINIKIFKIERKSEQKISIFNNKLVQTKLLRTTFNFTD